MSLYLKMLEEANVQLHLEFNQILPPMGQNIKCGNSLIGTDYFTSQLIPDPNEMRRVNPFDWGNEFPEIIKAGGFDCIVGNPPYIRIQVMKEWAPLEVEIYKEKYSTASSGNYDIYVVFVEKGLGLINGKGLLGFILPHKFFNAQYGETLRNLISKEHQLREVVHFGDLQIFDGASTYTCLMFLDKAGKNECQIERVLDLERWKTDGEAVIGVIPSKNITKDAWNFVVGENAGLFERLSKMPVKLEDVTDRIFQGIKTSADKIYIVEERERKNKKVKVFSPEKEKEYWLESDLLHPLIKGGDSKPFNLSKTNRLILFPYEKKGDAVELISQEIFKLRFPLTWAYLLENKHYLDDREKGRFKGNAWYQFGRSQALDVMPLPKIFTPDIATKPSFALDDNGELFFTGGAAGGYGILVSKNYSREFILGLLNSRLLEWFIRNSTTQMRGGWYSFESRFIKNLPILVVEDDKPEQVEIRDRIIELVKKIIPLSTDFYKTQSESDKGLYKRQIDSAVTEMNNLVNKLYGLTNEEIKFLDSNPK